MKLKDALENCNFYSTKASDVGRQLCFAGIAVIWLFKIDRNGMQKLPVFLMIPSLAFALSLFCDFLQYLYGSIAWDIFYNKREHEKGVDADTVFYAPKAMTRATFWLFNIKVSIVVLGYILLLGYLGAQLF
jgi:hypothetical protein